MRVLLVQPPGEALGFGEMVRGEPLGLEMVAGALEEGGHEVKILDLRIKGRGGLLKELDSFSPDACGISCSYSVDHFWTLEIAKGVKSQKEGVFVFVGGNHASMAWTDFPREIDAVVVGEGEETSRELLDALEQGGDLQGVKGLAINGRDGKVLTAPRPLLDDLDQLPFPKRIRPKGAGYYMGFQRPLALLETSRGCPFRCSFCSVWEFFHGKYRTKSPERVLEEILTLREPFVLFVDDNFLLDPDRAERIALLLKESKVRKRYTFQARSDSIVRHPELIRLWKEVGLKGVFIGFEKVRDEDLRGLRKGNTVRNNDQALSFLQGLGIDVWASFIVDPEFDHEDFRLLREYVISRRIKTPTFSVLTPLPGTELFREMESRLTTRDYRLFDIAHAVLPTKLSLEKFYQEFCSLYCLPYSKYRLIWEGFLAWLKGFPLGALLRMLRSAKRLSTPSHYLEAHRGLITPSLPAGRSYPP